ncbi:MAG: DUF2510 domain-containing protein [Actinomycetota bacterium]|nr:DUF2510 domain-containing protein [Actinomycetota bacterium]
MLLPLLFGLRPGGMTWVLGLVGALSMGCAYWLHQWSQRVRRGRAGWYPTCGEPDTLRYWDGGNWTDEQAVKARKRSTRAAE